MATTVPEAFRQLRANLEISDLQESTVATRQKNVRAALTDDFEIVEDFLTGSYRRSTLIAPLKTADVDIFIALAPRHFAQNGQKALLESVKRALKKTYPTTPDISPNGQAVTITFTDFKVDVVPGFKRQGGGYYIPDAELGRWIETDPKRHVEIWSASNKAHNGDLVPLLKMLPAASAVRAPATAGTTVARGVVGARTIARIAGDRLLDDPLLDRRIAEPRLGLCKVWRARRAKRDGTCERNVPDRSVHGCRPRRVLCS